MDLQKGGGLGAFRLADSDPGCSGDPARAADFGPGEAAARSQPGRSTRQVGGVPTSRSWSGIAGRIRWRPSSMKSTTCVRVNTRRRSTPGSRTCSRNTRRTSPSCATSTSAGKRGDRQAQGGIGHPARADGRRRQVRGRRRGTAQYRSGAVVLAREPGSACQPSAWPPLATDRSFLNPSPTLFPVPVPYPRPHP